MTIQLFNGPARLLLYIVPHILAIIIEILTILDSLRAGTLAHPSLHVPIHA